MSKPLCEICEEWVATKHLTPEVIVCSHCYKREDNLTRDLMEYYQKLEAEVENAKT